jgi:septum formation protein
MNPRLILASASSYRASLLARLGIAFATESPGIDEAPIAGEPPRARALRLAHAKAVVASSRAPEAWVLASDQVAVCGGEVHDKPGDADRCRDQLRASSGRAVEFHTAVVLLRGRPQAVLEHVDFTRVRFRPLAESEIARYVEIDRPFDCAGGFRSEGLGAALLQSIETEDPAALIGLPIIWVAQALREAGLNPLAPPQS